MKIKDIKQDVFLLLQGPKPYETQSNIVVGWHQYKQDEFARTIYLYTKSFAQSLILGSVQSDNISLSLIPKEDIHNLLKELYQKGIDYAIIDNKDVEYIGNSLFGKGTNESENVIFEIKKDVYVPPRTYFEITEDIFWNMCSAFEEIQRELHKQGNTTEEEIEMLLSMNQFLLDTTVRLYREPLVLVLYHDLENNEKKFISTGMHNVNYLEVYVNKNYVFPSVDKDEMGREVYFVNDSDFKKLTSPRHNGIQALAIRSNNKECMLAIGPQEDKIKYFKQILNDGKVLRFEWVRSYPRRIGSHEFTFDGGWTIYNLFRDYPHALTPQELAMFNAQNPYWVNFFKNRQNQNIGKKI